MVSKYSGASDWCFRIHRITCGETASRAGMEGSRNGSKPGERGGREFPERTGSRGKTPTRTGSG